MRGLRAVPLAVLLLAGCGGGGGTKTIVQTVTAGVPATTTTESVPTTTIATPPPTATTTAAASTPTATGRRKGKIGETFVLVGSEFAHVPSGRSTGPRDRITAQVTSIVDPITGYDIGKANRLVGIRMTVHNVGKVKYVDFQPSGDLTLVGGGAGKAESLISSGPESCKDPSLKLKPGAGGEVCMAFEVPKGAKLQSFQYTSDIGDGQPGVWTLG